MRTLRPTYRLFIGTPGSSNALAIVRDLGMPSSVIQQAEYDLTKHADGTSELINQVQRTRELAENKRRQAQRLLDKARALRAQAVQRLADIETEGRHLQQLADQEIERSMQAVQQCIEAFCHTMANAPKPWYTFSQDLVRDVRALAQSTPLAQRRQAFIDQLKKGDTVYIHAFKRHGTVDRIRRKRRVITVLVEGKELAMSFDQISRPIIYE